MNMEEYNKVYGSNLGEDLKRLMLEILKLKNVQDPWHVFVTPLDSPEILWEITPSIDNEDITSSVSLRFWVDQMIISHERLCMEHPQYEDMDVHVLPYCDPKNTIEHTVSLINLEIKNENEFLRNINENGSADGSTMR